MADAIRMVDKIPANNNRHYREQSSDLYQWVTRNTCRYERTFWPVHDNGKRCDDQSSKEVGDRHTTSSTETEIVSTGNKQRDN